MIAKKAILHTNVENLTHYEPDLNPHETNEMDYTVDSILADVNSKENSEDQMSDEGEYFRSSQTKIRRISCTQVKYFQNAWQDIEKKKVSSIPCDINGHVAFTINAKNRADLLQKCRDG